MTSAKPRSKDARAEFFMVFRPLIDHARRRHGFQKISLPQRPAGEKLY
jgi:hypothetical protein